MVAMSAAKAFIGALGMVSVGASECTNTTLHVTRQSTDVAVDSQGNVWFTTAGDGDDTVWRCPKDGDCKSIGPRGHWAQPVGIAVNKADISTVFYVSLGGAHMPTVQKCTLSYHEVEQFSCNNFGSGWTSPRGMAMDKEGNVYITDSGGDHQGVWKCSPSADCTLVGDSDGWQHFPPDNVAVDSQGSVYVTRKWVFGREATFMRMCTSAGVCIDGGSDDFEWPGFLHHLTVAVDADDNMYLSASGKSELFRFPHGEDPCDSLGAFDGGISMVIDQDGVFYIADHGGLRRVCLPPVIKDVQV